MIGKLRGKMEIISDNQAIIDVNGVGYLVFCSQKTFDYCHQTEYAELLIETHVREDHIHLYGFANSEEKSSFNLLQSVKGVGTKMALTILSHLNPQQLQTSLTRQDNLAFQQISGIGKKLAERIVIELKDKFINSNITINTSATSNNSGNDKVRDAITALVNLGINRQEAQLRVSNVLNNNPNLGISELIKLGLKKQ